jgi:ABC-type polysaccharide/polyol phosphate transport system ATPase subunit
MSSDVIIRAEGLGKKYVIGHQSSERYTALRDVMAQAARNFARTTRDMLRGQALVAGDETEEFWALKDINFEIKRGDVVGIIGRNGAGKSTLLKVLSRITEPTEGRVEIKGRVASLLEVGTGFHPELSGRENIYLNGAILGMGRAEITRKFDEIVDFAGVEKFLDTPVKRYSSGMYVRLAFAVAAHLEPEILIVDEVLAVGDAEFQKKCLGKMKDVSGQGRTVLFVSHNMGAVKELCPTSMLLRDGSIADFGKSFRMVMAYRDLGRGEEDHQSYADQNHELKAALDATRLQNGALHHAISVEIWTKNNIVASEIALIISSPDGSRVGVLDARCISSQLHLKAGRNRLTYSFDYIPMIGSEYELSFWFNGESVSWNANFGPILIDDYSNRKRLSLYSPDVNGPILFSGQIDMVNLND